MRSMILPMCCNVSPFLGLALLAGALIHHHGAAPTAPSSEVAAPAPAAVPASQPLPEGDYIRWLDANGATTSIVTAWEVVPHLDIKPGDCPNPLKTTATDVNDLFVSKVPASILGNAFDVTQIDLPSVHMSNDTGGGGGMFEGGAQVAPYQFQFLDTGTPFEGKGCGCHALNGDEELDLSMNFNRLQLVDVLELGDLPNGTDVDLVVTGTFLNGKGEFTIHDCVRISNTTGPQ